MTDLVAVEYIDKIISSLCHTYMNMNTKIHYQMNVQVYSYY